MSELTQVLRKEFKDKESAHIYVKEFLYENIATQIKVLREQRGWAQKELAAKVGMKQSRISLLENVNYDKWSISTLTKLAEVFDVGLYLTYEKFSTLIDIIDDFSRESLERPSRMDDLSSEQSTQHQITNSNIFTLRPNTTSTTPEFVDVLGISSKDEITSFIHDAQTDKKAIGF